MCDYCKKSKIIETEWNSLRVQVVGNVLEIGYDAYSTDSSFSTQVEIKYCMMCGGKLDNINVSANGS